MRLPLPVNLTKDFNPATLTDEEISQIVVDGTWKGNKISFDKFPMPLIRHYIKKFKTPIRRFNNEVAVRYIK